MNKTRQSVVMRLLIGSVLLIALLIVLAACGGTAPPPPPPPGGDLEEVPGQVSLPAGAAIDFATLTVLGAHGSFPVASDGSFTALLPAGATSELAVVDPDGELLLFAQRAGSEVLADTDTTASALLFYLLGGFMLPAEQHGELWELLSAEPALSALSEQLAEVLADGGRPLTDGGGEFEAALEQAWAAVLGAELASAGSATGAGAVLGPMQVGGSNNIVIEPGAGVLQSGGEAIHNPAGSGVAAQNHIRRPAALLAYQVGYEEAGGGRVDLDPPVLTRTMDVPSTGQLEFFHAIKDVLTGAAPWSPALSGGVPLTLHAGTHRTFYELVLLGPTLDTKPAPLYDDPRFLSQHPAWNEIIGEKGFEQFLFDIAMPLVESLAFGGTAVFDAKQLKAFRSEFRAATDTHLAGLGIFLKAGGSYASAVKLYLDDLATNTIYRKDLLEGYWRALSAGNANNNKLHFKAVEAKLKSTARASAILFAVQVTLTTGDLAAVFKDLKSAVRAVSWQATASPTLFYLSPEQAYFTKSQPSVALGVGTAGSVTGQFRYRWTTTGAYGRVSDGPTTGVSIDTPYHSVAYIHSSPLNITDEQSDSVTVEVFEVEPGATSIPAGAEPLARMTALLQGFNREIDSRLELQSGSTPPGYFKDGISVACSTMFLRIPKVAGAKGYDIQFSGWGGTGHEYNYNGRLFLDSSPKISIDPANANGYIWPFKGVCYWLDANGLPIAPPSFMTYDAGSDYLVQVFATKDFVAGSTIPPDYIGIGGQIQLWYDWASQGTITVTVVK